MPAKDIYHDLVKAALQKDGWKITHDPYRLSSGGTELFIDLGAEKSIAAEQGTKIAVKITSFLSSSKISDFYNALGQFVICKIGLEAHEPERILYLAIPKGINDELFSLKLIETVVQRYQIRLIVFEVKTGEIIQ